MSEITTKTIINFLPFDPKFKLELLEEYDSLSPDQQVRLTRLVWQTFDSFYQLRINEKFYKGIRDAGKTGQKIDGSYYQKVVEETDKEIDRQLAENQQSFDLSAARKSMEQIVREINAVRKSNQTPPKAS